MHKYWLLQRPLNQCSCIFLRWLTSWRCFWTHSDHMASWHMWIKMFAFTYNPQRPAVFYRIWRRYTVPFNCISNQWTIECLESANFNHDVDRKFACVTVGCWWNDTLHGCFYNGKKMWVSRISFYSLMGNNILCCSVCFLTRIIKTCLYSSWYCTEGKYSPRCYVCA